MTETVTANAADAAVKPDGATGALALADGTILWGLGVGAVGAAVG